MFSDFLRLISIKSIIFACQFCVWSMKKGRNSNLIALRDEALCRRYYYWTEVQRLRFDDALRLLSTQEFFISEERIMAIIRKKCSELKDIDVRPVPKVRKPHLTAKQLELFQDTAV